MNDLNPKKLETLFKSTFETMMIDDKKMTSIDSFLFLVFNKTTGNRTGKYLTLQFRNEIEQLFKEDEGDDATYIMLASNEKRLKSLEILGKYRLNLATQIDDNTLKTKTNDNVKLLRDGSVFKFLWVTDFPLFTFDDDVNRLTSTHHPFTAPCSSEIDNIYAMKNLEQITSHHYDLVLNGNEIAGGSIRIHDSKLQRHILENVLGETTDQLEHLLKALDFGAPPHGGIAFGLDRFVAIMLGCSNIKSVIAFPKNVQGKDLMGGAPSKVTNDELDYYRIKCA
jgi:aspartyl-tRNA synthetase